MTGGLVSAVHDLATTYPWYGLTFVTAFVTAWQLDNFPAAPGQPRPRYARCLECVAQAGVMAIAAAFVVAYGLPAAKGAISNLTDVLSYVHGHRAYVFGVIGITTAVGLAIGLTVPTWYREQRRSEDKPAAETRPAADVRTLESAVAARF